MCVYFRESVYRYRHIYIFLNLNNVWGLREVFTYILCLHHNLQVKLGLIISHFLLKDKTEAQGNFVINNNIIKKLKFIVDFLKLYTNGTM